MRPEDKQQYLDMLPRVFVRALRDPHGNEEYELSEGEATDLLRRREDFNGGALFDALHEIANLPEQGGCGDGIDAVDLWMLMQKKAKAALETYEAEHDLKAVQSDLSSTHKE